MKNDASTVFVRALAMSFERLSKTLLLVVFLLGGIALMGTPTAAVAGGGRIAVLEFELIDLTPLPGGAAELARTASLKPGLEQALENRYGYQPVAVDPKQVREANAGVGYLFDHSDIAATLGGRLGADWIAVGRIHKPSFLFAYLMVHLVEVESGRLMKDIIVEVKGPQAPVTARGVERLAEKIHAALARGPGT